MFAFQCVDIALRVCMCVCECVYVCVGRKWRRRLWAEQSIHSSFAVSLFSASTFSVLLCHHSDLSVDVLEEQDRDTLCNVSALVRSNSED